MSMNPEIKEAWASACEEPDRKQTTGTLRSIHGGQCCLDLLNELGVKAGIQDPPVVRSFSDFGEEEPWSDDYYSYPVPGDSFESEVLTAHVMFWSELTERDPRVEYNGKLRKLSELNDEEHLTLPEIGAIIRNSDL